MRSSEFIFESDTVDYVIYVNDKPVTAYPTREEAQRDLAEVKRKYPRDNIVIKRRHRHEEIGEDAGTTPGGIGSGTKMFLELDHSEDTIKESNPKWQEHQTPRQRVGIKNWHEIDRAYRQVNSKNPQDPLRLAHLKFFSEDPRTLSRKEVETVWNFLKTFFKDPKNQRNQLQVYDALSTNRGIEQILAMSRASVTEESGKFQQFIPPPQKPSLKGRWLVTHIPAGGHEPQHSDYDSDEKAIIAADKLKRSGHKIVGIPVQVSENTTTASKWKTLRPGMLSGSYSDGQLRQLGFKQNPDTKQWYILTTSWNKLASSGKLKE